MTSTRERKSGPLFSSVLGVSAYTPSPVSCTNSDKRFIIKIKQEKFTKLGNHETSKNT